jgi:hypothetical protein
LSVWIAQAGRHLLYPPVGNKKDGTLKKPKNSLTEKCLRAFFFSADRRLKPFKNLLFPTSFLIAEAVLMVDMIPL